MRRSAAIAMMPLLALAFIAGFVVEAFFGRVQTTFWMICIIVANFVLLAKGQAYAALLLIVVGVLVQWVVDRLQTRVKRRVMREQIERHYGSRLR